MESIVMSEENPTISQREVEIIYAQMQLLGLEDNLLEMRRILQTGRRVARELKKVPGLSPPVLAEFFKQLLARDAKFLRQVKEMRGALLKTHTLLSHGRESSTPPAKRA